MSVLDGVCPIGPGTTCVTCVRVQDGSCEIVTSGNAAGAYDWGCCKFCVLGAFDCDSLIQRHLWWPV